MADAVIVSTARTPIGKAFRGIFNDTHGADMGAHVIKHAAERAKVELGEVEDVILGCAAPGRHDRLQRRARLGDARRRAGQRLGRHREPLLLVGPADHLDGRPARAGRQGAGDDRGRPRIGVAGAGPAGRQQEPAGEPVGAGARAGHLPRHDHHRRHGGGALQDQPRGPGRVFAAEPDAHRGGPAGRQVRRRDRADGNHDAGHRQEHPGSARRRR